MLSLTQFVSALVNTIQVKAYSNIFEYAFTKKTLLRNFVYA